MAWLQLLGRGTEPRALIAVEMPYVALDPFPSMGDCLTLDDIHVEFSPRPGSKMVLDPGVGLDARIANMRNHVATEYGVLLPEIRL